MDILTAIILLSGTPGTLEPVPTVSEFIDLRGQVHKVALEWEILDHRETSYVFVRHAEFQRDLDMLRRRNVELRDAPRVCEAHKLPPRDWVIRMVCFNRDYRKILDTRRELELDREDILSAAICESDALYRVYDLVRDAKCESYYLPVRRYALMRLREQLGPEDWAAVRLPPVVPVWRFEE